jgi:beta-galactosidase/beta-glucuronidase
MTTGQRAVLGLVLLAAAPRQAHAQAPDVPRSEHPNPIFTRAPWQTLNGAWEFEFDDQDRGLAERWFAGARKLGKTIKVPFAFQSRLSGIGDTSFHDVVWYRRTFELPPSFKGKRTLLNFGAVDYEAAVWLNGERVGEHRGGHVGFALDVTDYVKAGENAVVVRVWDPGTDRSIPRGKQYWRLRSESIWYTRTTGIWQPVWIEAAGPVYVKRLRITPNVDESQVHVEAVLNRSLPDLKLRATVRLDNQTRAQSEIPAALLRPTAILKLTGQRLWSPERPTLYDLTVELLDAKGEPLDRVDSYFGQRKIAVHDGKVYLNNAPYYQRLVLDQGYWPESLLTPPSDAAIKHDIEMTKKFGLNGARKHQKVEDPRWLFWADKLGLIVWGEMANAQEYNEDYAARFIDEWTQIVNRDYNHPSIVTWVPINESWGVNQILTNRAQQEHAKTMYHLLRSLDQTRLVIDNDGWEHTDETDLLSLHDYARTGEQLVEKYKHLASEPWRVPRNGREAFAFGYKYNGTPFLMTEFGGIAYRLGAPAAQNEWGYSGIEPTKEAFLKRLDGLVKALRTEPVWAGYCYTQLTDVEQEINGLMTYDRKPKADPAELAKIFDPK